MGGASEFQLKHLRRDLSTRRVARHFAAFALAMIRDFAAGPAAGKIGDD